MILKKTLFISLLLVLQTGCTWVELSDEGEKARVLDASEVTNCKYVGKTTSTTTEKVVGVKRHDKAINLELLSLARNAAYRLGGDTVVVDDPAENGMQTFLVYRCVPK